MGAHREIEVKRLFNAATVTGTTVYSDIIDLGTYAQGGTFSIQYYAATAAVSTSMSYLLSNDGTNFVQSTEGHSIFTGVYLSSGFAADGRDIITFTPSMARFMKLAVWLSAGATSTLTIDFAIQ